jgi:hypothetical protein
MNDDMGLSRDATTNKTNECLLPRSEDNVRINIRLFKQLFGTDPLEQLPLVEKKKLLSLNLKVHRNVHKNPPLHSILGESSQQSHILFRFMRSGIFHLHLDLLNDFSSNSPTEMLYILHIPLRTILCISHYNFIKVTYVIRRK